MKFYQAISVYRLYFKTFLKKRRDSRGNLNTDQFFHIKTSYFYDRYAGYVFCKQNPHLLSLITECSHKKWCLKFAFTITQGVEVDTTNETTLTTQWVCWSQEMGVWQCRRRFSLLWRRLGISYNQMFFKAGKVLAPLERKVFNHTDCRQSHQILTLLGFRISWISEKLRTQRAVFHMEHRYLETDTQN